MQDFEASQIQLDALKEVGNISAGNAATAFSELVSRRVAMSVTEAHLVPVLTLEQDLSKGLMLGVYQRILGQAGGVLLVAFSRSSALELLKLVSEPSAQGSHRSLTGEDKDVLQELANIITGSYLTTLSKMTNLAFMPTVPRFVEDFTAFPLNETLQAFKVSQPSSVIFLNSLMIQNTAVVLRVYHIPDPKALPVILKAVGAPG